MTGEDTKRHEDCIGTRIRNSNAGMGKQAFDAARAATRKMFAVPNKMYWL
jgi:hypothetical protein